MYRLAWRATLLLGVSVFGGVEFRTVARAEEGASQPALGSIHLVLFGPNAQPVVGAILQVDGERATTDADGVLTLPVRPGSYVGALTLPSSGAATQHELKDLTVVSGETTQVVLTLSAAGAIEDIDVETPISARPDPLVQQSTLALPESAVSGNVVAAETGKPVQSAHVYARGAPVDAETDAAGAFQLRLPQGRYSLAVIHPRFSTQTVPEFVLSDAPITGLHIELSPASVELEELVVTAPHIEGGIASVSAERRESASVADVLGAEQMSKAGDSSAATALTRVTGLTIVGGKFIYIRGMGDRYSSTLLNGLRIPSPEPDVRVVPLDLFPAGLLESVLVQKGYSPEFPGDFGGGVVSLRTKTYPDKLTISTAIGFGGNTATTFRRGPSYKGGSLDWLGFDDGGRALPSAVASTPRIEAGSVFNPGGLAPAQVNELGRSFSNRWKLKDKFLLPDGDASIVIGNSFRLAPHLRWGFSTAGLYSHEWHLVRNAQRDLFNLQGARQRETRSDTLEREVLLGGMFDTGLTIFDDHKIKATTMVLRQTTDETFRITDGWWGEVDSDFRQSRFAFVERQLFSQQVAGEHIVRSLNALRVDWKYAYSMASRDEPDHLENLYWRSGEQYQLFTRSGSNLRFYSDLMDRLHDGRVDLTQPFPVWSSLEARFKAGAALFKQEREVNTRRFTLNATSATVDNLRLPPETVLGPGLIGVPGGTQFSEGTLPADPYTGSVAGTAGYGMLELPLAKYLEVMAGARLEKFDIKAETAERSARVKTLDLFPSSSLTAHMTKDIQLRASFAQTINRPDLRELVPSQFTDVQTGVTKRGNPDLQPASLRHYDARVEWYLSGDESVSLGGFYKTFDRPIELQLQGGATPTQTWSNAEGGRNAGVELEGRKRLGFLHDKLDDLYLSGNFAVIRSSVELAAGSIATNTKRPLAGQSPWVVNLQLGYDAPWLGLNTSLLYNVSGARIDSVGVMGLDDVMEQSFHQLDFVLAKEVKRGLRVSCKARNMLNSVRRFTQGDYLFARYRRGVDLSVDLTWNL